MRERVHKKISESCQIFASPIDNLTLTIYVIDKHRYQPNANNQESDEESVRKVMGMDLW